MGFLDAVLGVVNRVGQSVRDTVDILNPENWQRKIEENLNSFKDVFQKDWLNSSDVEKEAIVIEIKQRVIHDLIPLAGQLSLLGFPGIGVYTPCQIAGALAIAYVYDANYKFQWNYILTVAGITFWGQAGQFTWVQLINVIRDILPIPMLGIAVIPYVQAWTEIALNTVHASFKEGIKNEGEEPEVVKKTSELRTHLHRGGKTLFSTQQEIFRELTCSNNNQSALTLGKIHTINGVAGSGKTVILGQLIPHLISVYQKKYNRNPSILIYHFNNYIHELLEQEILAAMKAPIDLEPLPQSLFHQIVHVHTLTTLIKEELIKKHKLLNRDFLYLQFKNNSERAKKVFDLIKQKKELFDIVLIDEGQDINEYELALITSLCSNFIGDQTSSKSIYIFYDDLQNIFGNEGKVLGRISHDFYTSENDLIKHFLSTCIRSSKVIMDFTINTCLGFELDANSRMALASAINVEMLYEKGLIHNIEFENRLWIDCDFCVFPGEVSPEVQQFESNLLLFEAILSELETLIYEWRELNKELQNNNTDIYRRSVLIQCFKNQIAKDLYEYLSNKLNVNGRNEHEQIVQLRSGIKIPDRKRLAVEKSRINIANVWDAKGYDADVVYIINPDGCRGTDYEKRSQFYVAATRAKQFLAVYSSIPKKSAPIIQDAIKAVQFLKKRNV